MSEIFEELYKSVKNMCRVGAPYVVACECWEKGSKLESFSNSKILQLGLRGYKPISIGGTYTTKGGAFETEPAGCICTLFKQVILEKPDISSVTKEIIEAFKKLKERGEVEVE